jgi:hypothetical protein
VAAPARLSLAELTILIESLLRVFQPPTAGDSEAQRAGALRKAIPPALQDQARPLAHSVGSWSAQDLARDLRVIAMRAGYLASGSLADSVALLAAMVGSTPAAVLQEPTVRSLVAMAFA